MSRKHSTKSRPRKLTQEKADRLQRQITLVRGEPTWEEDRRPNPKKGRNQA